MKIKYIPYKEPTTKIGDEEWIRMQLPHHMLKQRRMELNMTPSEVAEEAMISVRQYQRFESGERRFTSASAELFMPICIALRLDPLEFFPLSTLSKSYGANDIEERGRVERIEKMLKSSFGIYDNVSFQEYKALVLQIPEGKLVTTKMVEEYFKRKKGLDCVYIDTYNVLDHIHKTYPFWRVVSNTGILGRTTKFHSRDFQEEQLKKEGFEIYECGANGASLRVRNYKDYLFDLNALI